MGASPAARNSARLTSLPSRLIQLHFFSVFFKNKKGSARGWGGGGGVRGGGGGGKNNQEQLARHKMTVSFRP